MIKIHHLTKIFACRITAAFYFAAVLVDTVLLTVVRDTNRENAWVSKEKAAVGSGSRTGVV
jgi:hypothetical protein